MADHGTVEHGARVVLVFFAILSILSMVLIFVIGIQPPNDWALYITLGFLILTAIVWFGFETRRFQGPPVGDMIIKRQAEIAAAEEALNKQAGGADCDNHEQRGTAPRFPHNSSGRFDHFVTMSDILLMYS